MSYTASGARRTGDEYQDLQSAAILIEWLEDPGRYRWVRLETQSGSLDDIQAERANGSLRLLQVKFSTDSASTWGWDDLTGNAKGAKAPKPSLLQKWKSSLDTVLAGGGIVSEAALRTNRDPAPEVRAHLSPEGLVDFSALSNPHKAKLSAQLGGPAEAAKFFANFRFFFNEPSQQALEEGLRRRFRNLGGTSDGWSNLIRSIRRWINLNDEPSPDGTITLVDIRAASLWHLPAEIPQGFAIPEDYVPPEAWSDAAVRPLLGGGSDSVVVVTGSPGAGKSTFLSWLVDRLRRDDVPAVRHHYFLSLADRTTGRADWEIAATSLIGQLKSRYPELINAVAHQNPVPEMLREYLEAAGGRRAGEHPLVVVVDGLDHVWRETGSSEGLRRLFDQLLPAAGGVVVIVGTQDVDMARLPAKLRERRPRETWLEVPRLASDEVRRWLRFHRDEFELPQDKQRGDELLNELADAFGKVAGGHPLLLHYALSTFREAGSHVRPAQIQTLPGFESQRSVADYYRRLWEEITPEGHQLLHLLAAFAWPWPRDGLVQCLAPHAQDPVRLERAERSVRHLLGHSPAGVTAFHESLLAFVRNQPDHLSVSDVLRTHVLEWLGGTAPEYWRWRYEWIVRADAGEVTPLVSSVTLAWCVDSLVAGRGRGDIARVVALAGWKALAVEHLGQATELHLLDSYLDQSQHSSGILDRLVWLATKRRPPQARVLELDLFLARGSEAPAEELGAAAEVAFSQGRLDACALILDEGLDRWDRALDSPELQMSAPFSSLRMHLPMLVASGTVDPSRGHYRTFLLEHGRIPDWCRSDAYAIALGRLCQTNQSTRTQRDELRFLANDPSRVSFRAVDEIVRLACRDGFDAETWVTDTEARRTGLFRCHRAWVCKRGDVLDGAPHVPSFLPILREGYVRDPASFAYTIRSYFFSCVAHTNEGRVLPVAAELNDSSATFGWLLTALRDVAVDIVERRKAGDPLGAAWFLRRLGNLKRPEFIVRDYTSRWLTPALLAQIVVIVAQDLEELFHAERGEWTLTPSVLQVACDGPWTSVRSWIDECVERRLGLVDAATARLLIDLERRRLKTTRDYLHTRAEAYASLAQFCHLYGEEDVVVREFSVLSARNLLGHGFHKDVVLFDVLAAIGAAPPPIDDVALSWLRAVSPVVQTINDITDRDTTRYLLRELADVVGQVTPKSLPGYIRTLQYRHHHWEVESCFTTLAKTLPFEGPYELALASTLIHEGALTTLQERVDRGDERAGAVLAGTLATFGRSSVDPREQGSSPSRQSTEPATAVPSIGAYPPVRLGEFVRALRDAGVYDDDHLAAWTAHWRLVDPDGLLAGLSQYRTAHGYLLEQKNARMVVELAAERAGWGAAWEWVVAYHDVAMGWTHYGYPLESVEWIWGLVRARFPDRWLEFIAQTARPRWGNLGGPPVWSTARMVRFLTAVGRPLVAQAVVTAAVGWGASLAADMELPVHALDPMESDLPAPLRLLVDRLDCPSRAVQERAGRALASLIASDETRRATAAALLEWHARGRLETRSCLLVLIGLLAHAAYGVTTTACLDFFRQADLVPSIGAYGLLRTLGTDGIALANTLVYLSRHSGAPPARFAGIERFALTVGAYLTPVFNRWASELDRHGIHFTFQWQWETFELAQRENLSSHLSPDFCFHYRGSANEPSLAVNDRVSSLLRSSYLRALHWARGRGLELLQCAIHAWRVGAMADPGLWAVDAGARPAWWPSNLAEETEVARLTNKVGAAVREILGAEAEGLTDVLGFVAGPLQTHESVRAELVICAYLQSAHGSSKPRSGDMAAIPRVGCRPLPPGFVDSATYVSFDPAADLVRGWLLAPLSWCYQGDVVDWLRPDRQERGLHLPPTWLLPGSPVITVDPDQVLVTFDDCPVAQYRYWNADLRERYYRDSVSRVGGELLLRREWLESQLSTGASLFWVATLFLVQRKAPGEVFGIPQPVKTWTFGGNPRVRATPWRPPDPHDE